MEQQPQNTRLRNAGFLTFFFSGICAISSGVVVSLLQEKYGFAYGMTGTLLSLMSIGNLLAGFLTGVLPGVLGFKPSVLLLTTGYALGYGMMGLSGAELLLSVSFFLVGIAKGSAMNACTILVSDNSADRTRGMNLMHSCYACGALLCPFLIAAAGRVSTGLALLVLAALGVIVWLIYLTTPMDGQGSSKKQNRQGEDRLELSALRAVLAADRPALLPERGRAERHGLDGHLLQGQRHHYRRAGGLYRHGHVGCHSGGPAPHCVRLPVQTAPQGHGGHGGGLHHLLFFPHAGPHAGGSHPAAVRLCLCHGGHEPPRLWPAPVR